MRRALALPAYRRLLATYALNELAWSFGSVALSLLVYRRTGSALGAMAFYLAANFVPALLSPMLVARLDRLAAARILPALYATEAVAFALLAVLTGSFSLIPVLALALADGTIAITARALARATTVAVVRPAGLLREGNALTNSAFSVCFMIGPALAGAVVALGSTRTALAVNVGVFTLMAIALLTAKGLPEAPDQRAPSAGRLRSALAHASGEPGIRGLLALQAASWLFLTMSIPVEVVFAQHTLHAGAGGYGAILSAWGGGTVIGSAIYARWHRLRPGVLLSAGLGGMGVGLVLMGAAPSVAVALVAAAIGGGGNGIASVAARTTLQELVEEQWMARIMSLWESVNEAVPGAGILLGGATAALAGPRVALITAGVGGILVTALVPSVLGRVPGLERAVG
jgi:MFS family permease